MNKIFKNILLYVGEIILATAIWSLLDYFFDDSIDVIYNLISVTVLVLICNITDYIAKKVKNRKNNK